ncbi:MAG TPA: hypothetical protein VG095_01180, partial [Chthoniobacterales bacterium]|nr:hypothetical protein [Chthoniobacterales bacterium]
IEALVVRRRGKCITIEISGSGFLYKMARMMVAALVQHARGRAPAGEIRARLAQPEKVFANARLVAPAAGLFLVRVRY